MPCISFKVKMMDSQMLKIYHKFTANHVLAWVYLALEKLDLRKQWLQEILEG
jgi:hypothetical protein